MNKSELLMGEFIPPLAPPLPRMTATGLDKPAVKKKEIKVLTGSEADAADRAAAKRVKKRIKSFYATAPGPVVNLGELLNQ